MQRFTHHQEGWGYFLDVKRCRKAIRPAYYEGRRIVLSTVTDAYNPLEKKFGVTRDILRAFAGSGARISILTKSDLVLRDLDLLKKLPGVEVGLSMNTLNEDLCRETEPGAPGVTKRIHALGVLKEEGIPCHVFISPIFPGITNFREIIEACLPHTNTFHFENLNLRGEFRPRVLQFIARFDANLLPLYEDIYSRLDLGFWDAMEKDIIDFCTRRGIEYISYFYHERNKKRSTPLPSSRLPPQSHP
jgi:DNA repair photolyase